MTSISTTEAPVPQAIGEVSRDRGDFVPGDDYFSRPRRPFGDAALDLGIGSIRLHLEGLSNEQADLLGHRFRPFVVGPDAGSRPDLTISATRAGVRWFLAPPDGRAEFYRMGRRTSDQGLTFWSYEFAGVLRPDERRADLALVAPTGPVFDRGLENFLRPVTATLALHGGGLLLHGSGVVRGGRAYIFFGPSGSGKTTVTEFSPRDTILSDDLTLLVPGEGGYRATGIPFGLAHHHVPDTCGNFPVASLNRLVQSHEVKRQPLSMARALAEVASCLPFVMADPSTAPQALDVAGRLLSSVPVFRLHFRRDDSFWSVVEER